MFYEILHWNINTYVCIITWNEMDPLFHVQSLNEIPSPAGGETDSSWGRITSVSPLTDSPNIMKDWIVCFLASNTKRRWLGHGKSLLWSSTFQTVRAATQFTSTHVQDPWKRPKTLVPTQTGLCFVRLALWDLFLTSRGMQSAENQTLSAGGTMRWWILLVPRKPLEPGALFVSQTC